MPARTEKQRRRAPADAPAEAPARSQHRGGPLVLVVDDQRLNLEMARALLQRRDIAADLARSGEEGLERLQQQSYDLLLLDWQMPGLDGLDVARAHRLFEAEHRLARLPIVAVTANTKDGAREECLAAGMDDYIAKPLRPLQLDRALARWLAGCGDAPAPLDARVLAAVVDPTDPSFLAELVALFSEDAAPRLAALDAAVAVRDLEGVAGAAHALRGSAANLGAVVLAELCKRVERWARSKPDPGSGGDAELPRLVEAIRRELARAQAALRVACSD